MELQGKKVAILVENFYEDSELWVPYYRMLEAGAAVDLLGTGKNEYASKHGVPAKEDKPVDAADPKTYDAVIVPGGYSPDHMRRHPPMISFLKKAFEEEKIIAAICHAGWMLVSADIVKGKNVTGFNSIKDDLINAGGIYKDAEVVQDGRLITSRSPKDLPAFCRAIVTALSQGSK